LQPPLLQYAVELMLEQLYALEFDVLLEQKYSFSSAELWQ